jgi:hypothetical protein
LMPNSKLSRNAEYVSNAQLSQASSPENRPLDSTKTQNNNPSAIGRVSIRYLTHTS